MLWSRSVWVIVVIALLTSCGGSSSGGGAGGAIGEGGGTSPINVSEINNSTDVAISSSFLYTFSKVVSTSTVTTTTYFIEATSDEDPCNSGNALAASVSCISSTECVLDPTSDLSSGTAYTICLIGGTASQSDISNMSGIFQDSSGMTISYAGGDIFESVRINFRTKSNSNIEIGSVTPPDGATDVAINTNIIIEFSGEVDASMVNSNSFTVRYGDESATHYIAGTFTYSSNIVTFDPESDLSYNTTYTVNMAGGSGTRLSAAYSWSFTTADEPDTTAPSVSSKYPFSGATDVPITTTITATFSEAMDQSTITTASFSLSPAAAGSISYSNRIATYTPSENLSYSTIYTIAILTTVKDSAGNMLSSAVTWSFTTADEPDTMAPTVDSTSPDDEETDVELDSNITVTFSETMNSSTIDTESFTIVDEDENGVSGTISYASLTATFNPGSDLGYLKEYTATISTDVMDTANNPLASEYTWSFTTIPTSGTLDTTFGASGHVVQQIDSESSQEFVYDIAVQSDRKIVAVGKRLHATSKDDIVVARFNANGSLDTSFGDSGVVIWAGDTDVDFAEATAVAIDSSENIVVAGRSSTSNRVVIRLDSDGEFDTSFGGGDGIVTTATDRGRDMILDGTKIVVVGQDIITKYNSDGTLDSTFGTDGMFDIGTFVDLYGVVKDGNGKYVVVGRDHNGTDNDIYTARVNSDGSLDTTFSGDGYDLQDSGNGNDYAFAVDLQSDGKIAVAVQYKVSSSNQYGVVNYNSNGTLNTAFGTDGIVTTNFDGVSSPRALDIIVQGDDKIITVGWAARMVRYNTDGSLDTSFNDDGIYWSQTVEYPGAYPVEAIARQPDGRFVTGGHYDYSAFYLERIE